ncbi:MAG TPA: hypothetical protein VEH04_19865 [Verrucomicrobiae bacterium]|nr:hypothetical protein [Verrucomicrobiae bacterium]
MPPEIPSLHRFKIGTLLRGEPEPVLGWTRQWQARSLATHVLIVVIGAGCFGAAVGWWRAPQQALYTAVKFPLLVLLTTCGTALLNGMLAPLLGLNIPFRQSFLTILMSFSIAAAILGAFSPVAAFMIWNAPPIDNAAMRSGAYSFILLTHVIIIAFAGIAANVRLRQLLRVIGGPAAANRVLFAWLAANLFVGSQLSWVFRPFIGAPGLPLQFLRDEPLSGNFYEAVFRSLMRLIS